MRPPAAILILLVITLALYNAASIMEVVGYDFGYQLSKQELPDGTKVITVDPSRLSAKELQRCLINVAFAVDFLAMGYLLGTARLKWWGWIIAAYFTIQAVQVVHTGNLFSREWVDEVGLLACFAMGEVFIRRISIRTRPKLKLVWHRKNAIEG